MDKKKNQEWRQKVIERDKCCAICLRSDVRLNVHHLIPKQFEKFRYDVNNGIVLCTHHHTLGKFSPHKNAIWFAKWLYNNKRDTYDWVIENLPVK